jgi:murein DD-endopeptidase MepM/ murein hydrolase activator NlpD
MSSAQRTPRYVDAIRSYDTIGNGGSTDVIRLRPEPVGPALPPITRAWPRLKAVPVARRPWQLLLVPPTPGAPTRSFHVARWQARLVIAAASVALVVAGAGIAAFVLAVRSPDLFATSAEAALLRDRLIVMEDSLALARAELEAPDELVLPGGDAAAALADRSADGTTRLVPSSARAAARRRAASMSADDARGLSVGGGEGLPVIGSIASRFSRSRRHPILRVVRPHLGVDVSARRGTQISAPAAGRVSFVGRRFGFGLVVEIQHGNGVTTRYAHCASALVKEGTRVQRGVPIATVGTSGMATGPHLHYEVLVNGRQVDPLRFQIPQGSDSATAPVTPPPAATPKVAPAAGAVVPTAPAPDSSTPR